MVQPSAGGQCLDWITSVYGPWFVFEVWTSFPINHTMTSSPCFIALSSNHFQHFLEFKQKEDLATLSFLNCLIPADLDSTAQLICADAVWFNLKLLLAVCG